MGRNDKRRVKTRHIGFGITVPYADITPDLGMEIKSVPQFNSLVAKTLEIEPDARMYKMGNLMIIVGRTDETGWHISISHPTRLPTHAEIAKIRYTLAPDYVTMAMKFPPLKDYINLHETTMHLWEIKDG